MKPANRFMFFWLSLFIAFVYLLQLAIPGFTEFLLLDSSKLPLEFWRYLTAIFLHASPAHILYNLFALLLFGFILEAIIGTKKFLFVFFTTGIIANVIAAFFYPSSLGASGAIFGLIGTLVVLRPKMPIWAFGIPMPMFIAAILWVAGAILGIFGFNAQAGVGNIAHLSGILFGLMIGIYYRVRMPREEDKESRDKKDKITIPENAIRNWEDYVMSDL